MFKASKRFIAGAVCPRCAKSDKLVVYRQEGKEYRECVSCGFREEMHFPPLVREPDTRVNRTAEQKQEETSLVKILESTPSKDKKA